jgi:hypothetical protein
MADKIAWHASHKQLPRKDKPLAYNLPDKFQRKETETTLKPEKWENPIVALSRSQKDSRIAGKPDIKKFFKSLKPEHLDREFDGSFKPFKSIK